MNGLVPLFPVLTEVARVPPIAIESSVCELCELRQEIEPRVEDEIEHREPEVRRRHCHVQSRQHDLQVVPRPKVHQ